MAALRADAEHRARQAEMDRATCRGEGRRGTQAAAHAAGTGADRARAARGHSATRRGGSTAWRARERARTIAGRRTPDAKPRRTARRPRYDRAQRGAALATRCTTSRAKGRSRPTTRRGGRLTLTAARSALQRAEGLLAAGEPTDGSARRGRRREVELGRRRPRPHACSAELDRIAEENDDPAHHAVSLSRKSARAVRGRVPRGDRNGPHEQPRGNRGGPWMKANRFRDGWPRGPQLAQAAPPTYGDLVSWGPIVRNTPGLALVGETGGTLATGRSSRARLTGAERRCHRRSVHPRVVERHRRKDRRRPQDTAHPPGIARGCPPANCPRSRTD